MVTHGTYIIIRVLNDMAPTHNKTRLRTPQTVTVFAEQKSPQFSTHAASGVRPMKYIIVILVFLLSGCDRLSLQEGFLLGHWKWEVSREGYQENGYLILNRNKTFKYEINSCIPVECLGEKFVGSIGIWTLNDESICFASEFTEEGVFSKAIISKQKCLFHNILVKNDVLTFNLNGFFYNDTLQAKKQ